MRKTIFVASLTLMIALTVTGLNLSGLLTGGRASAAGSSPGQPAEPVAQGATCEIPIDNLQATLIKSASRPGLPAFKLFQSVKVTFDSNHIPACFTVKAFTVKVRVLFANGGEKNVTRTIPGDQRQVTVPVSSIFQIATSAPTAIFAEVSATATATINGKEDVAVDID